MSQSVFDSTELPALNTSRHCVLMSRDPDVVYAYWNYTQQDVDHARSKLNGNSIDSKLVLRIYDVTTIGFNGTPSWDVDVGFSTKNAYIPVACDNAQYCVELGLISPDNHFISIERSNTVQTPPHSFSKRNDLIWQDIKAQKRSRPYIKEEISKKKSHKGHQSKNPRSYYLTAQDVRNYYTHLLAKISPGQGSSIKDILKRKLKRISWQKARVLWTSDLIKSSHVAASLVSQSGAGASELLRVQSPKWGQGEHA